MTQENNPGDVDERRAKWGVPQELGSEEKPAAPRVKRPAHTLGTQSGTCESFCRDRRPVGQQEVAGSIFLAKKGTRHNTSNVGPSCLPSRLLGALASQPSF